MPKSPPPNSYSIKSTFEPALQKSLSIQFGESRHKMESTGPLAVLKRNTNPGPGSYQLRSTLSQSAYSFPCDVNKEDKE